MTAVETAEAGHVQPDDWGRLDPRWAGIRTEWLDVRGTRVRILRVDPATPDATTPQLLLHGLGGSATNWLEVMVGLARYGPVVAPDLPGFGETAPPRPSAARVQVNARFVPALMDTLGWDQADVHGNSMGGLLAVLVAANDHVRVRRLVLVNPGLPAPRKDMHRIPTMALLTFGPFLVAGVGERLFRYRLARSPAEELYEQTVDLVYADPDRLRPPLRDVAVANVERGKQHDWRIPSFAAAAESLVAMLVGARRVTQAVDRVAAPTLLVWGDRDRLVGRAVIDGLAARRPDWDLHVFEGCGHVPMLEFPDAHLDVVERWYAAQR